MEVVTDMVTKVEAVSVAKSVVEYVVETARERIKIESAWKWLVDAPELSNVILTRITELEMARVEQTLKEEILLRKRCRSRRGIIKKRETDCWHWESIDGGGCQGSVGGHSGGLRDIFKP